MKKEIKLVKVFATEIEALKDYVEALYRHEEYVDSLVNIENGVRSLLRNEALATPYFIKAGEDRVGYVILTKYHSVEKGGLTIYIDELYVEEQKRRHGVGKEIMDQILEIAKNQGAKTLWAQTESYNDPAQKFFVSRGFKQNPNLNFERPL
jgi:diamine N-acetyltransferase